MIKKIIVTLSLLLVVFPANVEAVRCVDPQTGAANERTSDTCPAGTAEVAELTDLETLFSNVIQVVGLLIILAFFAMMITGGVKYLLSGGDPKAVQAAKGTITWAIAGLAFFALSYTILLLIEVFTGVNVTIFRISGF